MLFSKFSTKWTSINRYSDARAWINNTRIQINMSKVSGEEFHVSLIKVFWVTRIVVSINQETVRLTAILISIEKKRSPLHQKEKMSPLQSGKNPNNRQPFDEHQREYKMESFHSPNNKTLNLAFGAPGPELLRQCTDKLKLATEHLQVMIDSIYIVRTFTHIFSDFTQEKSGWRLWYIRLWKDAWQFGCSCEFCQVSQWWLWDTGWSVSDGVIFFEKGSSLDLFFFD